MNQPDSSTSSARLEAAVAEYLESLERGENPNRAAMLERFADVATDLAEFFVEHDRVDGLAKPNRTTDLPLETTELLNPGVPASSDVSWRSAPSTQPAPLGQIGQYQ